MFGYILPDKPSLSPGELAHYRSVYCSLCYALKKFGVGAKALLNYDFVFAAMLHMALTDTEPSFYTGRCNTNPFQKERLVKQNDALQYAAAALILTSHYKLRDDMQDERLPKRIAAFFINLCTAGAQRHARLMYPGLDASIAGQMQAQQRVERQNTSNIDLACDATAQGLCAIFAGMSEDSDTTKTLQRLGYLMGRFVYLADACDDLKNDVKYKRFNVFINKYHLLSGSDTAEALAEATAQLRLTAGEIDLCYRLLAVKYFTPILDNIIYNGLLATAEKIGSEQKGQKNARSL